MLTVDRATLIINRMKVCWLLGKPITRHSVANEIKTMSRSTVYRVINRMIELGMLSMSPNKKGNLEVSLTSKGQDFIDSVKEMF